MGKVKASGILCRAADLQNVEHGFNWTAQARPLGGDDKRPVQENGMFCHGLQQGIVLDGGITQTEFGVDGLFGTHGLTHGEAGVLDQLFKLRARQRGFQVFDYLRLVALAADKFKRVTRRAATGVVIDRDHAFILRQPLRRVSTAQGLPPCRHTATVRRVCRHAFAENMTDFHALQARLITGETIDFSRYRGQVVLVVNVASKCGFTPQYEGLEALYQAYQAQGFIVLGFPCNQFRQQEPGSASDIQAFCATTYQVSFPIFEKIDVNGAQAHPVYRWLKTSKPGLLNTESIKWNFTKFLVGRDGQVIDRYAPTTKPEALRRPIEAALAQPLNT